MSMRSLTKRIEALEETELKRRKALRQVQFLTIEFIWPDVLALLISAHSADRAGRSLTEAEVGARQAYSVALEKACARAGVSSAASLGSKPDIYYLILQGLVERLGEQLRLAHHGPPGEEQEAAYQAYASTLRDLCRSAGYNYVHEFWLSLSAARSKEILICNPFRPKSRSDGPPPVSPAEPSPLAQPVDNPMATTQQMEGSQLPEGGAQ